MELEDLFFIRTRKPQFFFLLKLKSVYVGVERFCTSVPTGGEIGGYKEAGGDGLPAGRISEEDPGPRDQAQGLPRRNPPRGSLPPVLQPGDL